MKISLTLIVCLLGVVNVHGHWNDWFKNFGRVQIIPARRFESITKPFGTFVNNMLNTVMPNRVKIVNNLMLTTAGFISPEVLSGTLALNEVKLSGLSGLEIQKLGFKLLGGPRLDFTLGSHKINLRAEYDTNVTVMGRSRLFGKGTIYSFLHLPTISGEILLQREAYVGKFSGTLDKFHLNITGLWNDDKKSAEISQFVSDQITSLARKKTNIVWSLFKLVPFIIKNFF